MTDIVALKEQVNKELANTETLKTLIATTFKGLEPATVKRAMLEGYLRGYKFEDFLQKHVYAIPFKDTYSLVTSIDYARKIGMRSGVVGKSEPKFEHGEKGEIISCTVTIKRKVNEYVGDYTATVYFKEFSTGRNLWATKPHAMLSKVAEMHSLRMACPEEMSQMYVEEEYEQEKEGVNVFVNVKEYEEKLNAATTIDELKKTFLQFPATAKAQLKDLYTQLKNKFEGVVETDNQKEQKKFLEKEGVNSIPF